MRNSELYQIIFQCLISNEISGFDLDFKNKILPNEDNLLKFIRLSSNHLIIPAIYERLKKKRISDYLPTVLAEHLNEILLLNIKRNEEIIQQIVEICHHLNRVGIEPVFMKGTANLLDGLYTNFADRMIGDIDFLVKERDYFKAAEVIKKIGYKQDETEILVELNTFTHYPRLYRNDVPADIEIHRTPVIEKYNKKFNSDIIFDKKKNIPAHLNCFVTCDEHKLIHTFIHSQLSNNGYSYRIASLRDLYDFYLISKRIDFYSVFPEIEERKKADIFFKLVQQMCKPETDVNSNKSKIISKKVRKFIWFLNHPRQHGYYINLVKIIDVFVERPFFKIRDALLYPASRKSLIIRLKNPDWYISTFKGIRSFFK